MKYTRHNIRKGICIRLSTKSVYTYRIEDIVKRGRGGYRKEMVDIKNLELGSVMTMNMKDLIKDLNTNFIYIVKKIDYEIY